MRIIAKKSAIKAFYYLMAVDGEVCGSELEKFNEIGNELDGDSFDKYKASLIKTCREQIDTAIGEGNYYDVIQEGLDEALCSVESQDQGIAARLLVWNMLAIAFSNDQYSDTERLMISHVVRTTKIDQSVFLEMEQLIKTAASVAKESEWIKGSDKPYAEVRPIVDELEKRQRVILESARALIEDEIEPNEPYRDDSNPGFFENAKAMIGEKVSPIASEIGAKTQKAIVEAKVKIGEKIAPLESGISVKADRFFSGIKKHKKGDDSAADS